MQIRRLEDKCNKCMLCVRDCVSGVWRVVDGVPAAVQPDLCNLCSHCIAVCPRSAIVHDGLDAAQTVRVNRKNLQPNVYRDIVMSRRSVRQFKDKPVPRSIIEQVLDLARYAPTASNEQNVGYIVITDKKLIEKTAKDIFGFASRLYDKTKKGIVRLIVQGTGLANNRYLKAMDFTQKQNAETGRDFILHNAPVLILVHAPKKGRFGCDNCNIAATTMINHAHSLGLGTCFIGFLTVALRYSSKMRKRLGVPVDRKVHASLVMGYPSYQHAGTVSRKKPEVKWV
jgi:nitroreductase/NAD-dependent dihydropyrimidine dehydrogenase PreA subunit